MCKKVPQLASIGQMKEGENMPGGNQKQPIDLVIAKGKKHLTKKEIEERKKSEIKVPFIDVKPPEYLTEEQKDEFKKIADILLNIGIMTELDEDSLAHYIISNTNYVLYTKELRIINNKLQKTKSASKKKEYMSKLDLYLIYQDRALKQCRACANDLGLSISSRCKLVMPPTKKQPKENKFAKFKVIG